MSAHALVPSLMTAEELLRLNLPNKRSELVRGVLVVRADGSESILGVTDALRGEDVLPGFEYGLRAIR